MAGPRSSFHEAIQEAERQRGGAMPRAAGQDAGVRRGRPGLGSAGFWALRQPLVWALLLLAFALGRWSVGPSSAPPRALAQGQPNPAPAGSAVRPPLELPGLDARSHLGGAPLKDMERALLDPANLYTVLAITYDVSERNQRWAQDRVSHFASQDLPVAPPQTAGSHILILVGASPDTAGLGNLLLRVKNTPDVNGRVGAFSSALIVPIDDHLRRG